MKKTILITGASTGLGRSTAKLFQSKGWNVVATMRQPENETELNTLSNVLVTKLDVLNLESIDKAIEQGIQKFEKIDVLLNNAGYCAYGPLESFPREGVLRQFNTNVIGLLDVTQKILPHFRQNRSGIVINISSVGGKLAFPLGTLYHGTKFAVEGITEALSYEMAEFGGKAKIVEPGAIATDFLSRSLHFSSDESLTEYQSIIDKMFASTTVMFESATSSDTIAQVILEAATDNKDTLRYIAGEDAKMLIASRKQMDDDTFMEGLKVQMGI